jgi:hypothetical protein
MITTMIPGFLVGHCPVSVIHPHEIADEISESNEGTYARERIKKIKSYFEFTESDNNYANNPILILYSNK